MQPGTGNQRAEARDASPSAPNTRIVILGGGFGGVFTARHLEKLFQRRPPHPTRSRSGGESKGGDRMSRSFWSVGTTFSS
jgi:cation diffusion facilitator CzcD-associated flavoprotein CzcO